MSSLHGIVRAGDGIFWGFVLLHHSCTKLRKKKPLTGTRGASTCWFVFRCLYPATPTLSRSFVVAPFRLGLVWLSVLSTLPPNPSACPRASVWDKPWDKFAN